MKIPHYYWDANAFLTVIKKEKGYESFEAIIEIAEKGEAKIVTSALTLTEVIKLKGRQPMQMGDEPVIKGFFKRDYLVIQNVDRQLAEQARQLIWEQKLNPKDAIHVASALAFGHKIDEMHTSDGQLLKLNVFKGLKITTPNIRIQGNLPLPITPKNPAD